MKEKREAPPAQEAAQAWTVFQLRLPWTMREAWKAHCEKSGASMNSRLLELMRRDMEAGAAAPPADGVKGSKGGATDGK